MKKLDVVEIITKMALIFAGLLVGKQISKLINPWVPQAGIPQE